MLVRWNYVGCTESDKRLIERAWHEVQPGLEDRLEYVDGQPLELTFRVVHEPQRTLPWRVNAVLKLDQGIYLADVRMSAGGLAVDECVARIADQITEDPQSLLEVHQDRSAAVFAPVS